MFHMFYLSHSWQNSSETLATFSLPAGLAYPVQIPAGVTLQTASGNKMASPFRDLNLCSFILHTGLSSTSHFPSVSLRSALQGQCSCCGDSNRSRSAVYVPTLPEGHRVERSSCPIKCHSSGGGAALCSSSFCHTAVPSKDQFTLQ